MKEKTLVVTGLEKLFPPAEKGGSPFRAVSDVSFSVNHGEILGLLGPNGAGKSTTIAMLLDILTPTAGTIEYFGKSLHEHKTEILQKVTFASTYIKMPWRLTVLENLQVYGRLYGLSHNTFQKRCKHFLTFFEVWNQRNKTMNQLSAGQITRVMLAKAFIPHPKVVLLDEPTASLDPDIAHQVRQFVKEQQEEFTTTIVYTSHNMDEVADVCDRVVFLRNGSVVATDTPAALAQSITTCTMHLGIDDGLKRTARFAKEQGLKVMVHEREVEIVLQEHDIAQFLTKLAAEGITYSQISIDKPTLEDYFLSMSTKGQS